MTDNIQKVLDQAQREKWNYPRTFDALKAVGVTHYETVVAKHHITYFTAGGTWQAPVPAGHLDLIVAPQLNDAAFMKALRRAQAGEINYPTFLKEIAAAGCSHYRVDMPARTVTYKDDHGHQIVEPVPPSN